MLPATACTSLNEGSFRTLFKNSVTSSLVTSFNPRHDSQSVKPQKICDYIVSKTTPFSSHWLHFTKLNHQIDPGITVVVKTNNDLLQIIWQSEKLYFAVINRLFLPIISFRLNCLLHLLPFPLPSFVFLLYQQYSWWDLFLP